MHVHNKLKQALLYKIFLAKDTTGKTSKVLGYNISEKRDPDYGEDNHDDYEQEHNVRHVCR